MKARELIKKNKTKLIVSSVLALVITGIVTVVIREWESSLDTKDREVFMEWFGSGAVIDENGNEPLPVLDSHVVQHALIWEEEGLYGLGILDDREIRLMLANENFHALDSQTQKEVELLLRGGFPLIRDYDDGIIFDAYRFEMAIRQINTIIREARDIEYRTIQVEWDRTLNASN